ncbi:hypothetical protein Q4595_18070, partial [Wenyingzhuangia sp. 1_MG-2023]|nr:hypothetical protein [Wenyingzhuangia sp. 1_MG-2023]
MLSVLDASRLCYVITTQNLNNQGLQSMFAQRNRKILFLAITSALLSACGSSDDSSSSSDDHDHSDEYGQRLVMAEQTSQD